MVACSVWVLYLRALGDIVTVEGSAALAHLRLLGGVITNSDFRFGSRKKEVYKIMMKKMKANQIMKKMKTKLLWKKVQRLMLMMFF